MVIMIGLGINKNINLKNIYLSWFLKFFGKYKEVNLFLYYYYIWDNLNFCVENLES